MNDNIAMTNEHVHLIPPIIKMKKLRGWTIPNTSIIEKWKSQLEESSFIYADIASHYDLRVRTVLILSLLTSAVMTILAALTLTLGPLGDQWVVLGINVSLLAGSAFISVVNGFVKAFSWDDKVHTYGDYSQSLFSFWAVLDSEMTLPPSQRIYASEFIKRKVSEYANLMQQGPNVSVKDYNRSSHKYKNSLYNEVLWNLKYKKKLADINEV